MSKSSERVTRQRSISRFFSPARARRHAILREQPLAEDGCLYSHSRNREKRHCWMDYRYLANWPRNLIPYAGNIPPPVCFSRRTISIRARLCCRQCRSRLSRKVRLVEGKRKRVPHFLSTLLQASSPLNSIPRQRRKKRDPVNRDG